jgi:hypothetical protein
MSNQRNTPETDAMQPNKTFGQAADLFAMRNHARNMEVQRDAIKRQRDDLISLIESVLDGSAFDSHPITKATVQDWLKEIKEESK